MYPPTIVVPALAHVMPQKVKISLSANDESAHSLLEFVECYALADCEWTVIKFKATK
jgi:hypothetical protein